MGKKKPLLKTVPFEFVIDALAKADPRTRAMFGCTAVYLGDRITFILRDRADSVADNGVWFATTGEHHESLRRDFPTLRSIRVFQESPDQETGWQVLPADADGFEADALKACRLALRGDLRIGKVPARRAARRRKKK